MARMLELEEWLRRNKNQRKVPFQNVTFMLIHNCNIPLILSAIICTPKPFLKKYYTLHFNLTHKKQCFGIVKIHESVGDEVEIKGYVFLHAHRKSHPLLGLTL